MFTITINDKTMSQIAEFGDRIAEDAIKLENLIWLVKAESIKQLAAAARAYTQAYEENRTTTELVIALQEAAGRTALLEKFWSQEVGMRNRAGQFGDMARRRVPGWQALEAVMKQMLAEKADTADVAAAETADAG